MGRIFGENPFFFRTFGKSPSVSLYSGEPQGSPKMYSMKIDFIGNLPTRFPLESDTKSEKSFGIVAVFT